jgi:hypothetical protein
MKRKEHVRERMEKKIAFVRLEPIPSAVRTDVLSQLE